MDDVYILAIETSCDETSMAIIKNENEIISHVINSQVEEFESLGGVVPEMAARIHEKNIFYVYEEILNKANMSINQIDAISVTYGPGLIGSLLAGVNFANSLALLYGKKLIKVNHMQAHIMAINIEHQIKYPHLSLIVSGGHTELVLLEDCNNYKILGQTLDDAVGESYDKVARLLNLGYPGGPLIDKLSYDGVHSYDLPMPKNDQSLDFSFSGLKSASFNLVNQLNMKNEEINSADFACSYQNVVVQTLVNKLKLAAEANEFKSISIVGGVSANSLLRKRVKEEFPEILIPSNIYSTDNAAMIGIRGFQLYNNNMIENGFINAKPNLSCEE